MADTGANGDPKENSRDKNKSEGERRIGGNKIKN